MRTSAVGATIGVLLLAGGAVAGCAATPVPEHPHAGHSAPSAPDAGNAPRYDIKALTPQQIDDLLHGRGANLALAAECNDLPGPAHVIELADRMRLSPEQRELTRKLAERMRGEARDLGRRILDVEQSLDAGFRSRTINAERLAALTAASASLGGQLRDVHLRAHLDMRAALTEEQINVYYEGRRGSGKCVT